MQESDEEKARKEGEIVDIDSANEGIIVDVVLSEKDIKKLFLRQELVCVDDLGWPPIKGRKIMVRLIYEPYDDEAKD